MVKVIMTESTKFAVKEALNIDIESLSDEAIIEAVRNNPNFALSFKEAGQVKIKRVLKG